MMMRGVGAILLSLSSGFQEPGTQWIWSSSERAGERHAAFEHTFTLPTGIASARLRALGDFAGIVVSLNGRKIAESEAYGPLIDLDAVRILRPGENLIRLDARGVPGPSAVAFELRLALPGGDVRTIGTSGNWRLPGAPDRKPGTFGALDRELWWTRPPITINELDDYTQWKQAIELGKGTDPRTFQALEGFSVELVHSARKGEGSWVSVAFDPRGRVLIGNEDPGILRFTLTEDRTGITSVERVNDTLRECRGLTFKGGTLFVNANDSKAFYRLRDTDGDGTFDEETKLYDTPGGDGHGRNDITVGPDGKIYAIHGDAVRLPRGIVDRTSPLRRRHPPFRPNEGHVTCVNPDGTGREIFAAGLRNPYGIAFNADGEAFTYDADAEHDMGVPWYRPTRVNHLTSGADIGWRAVTGSWPPYFPDHPDHSRPTLTIGKGSPTAVLFGTGSAFPEAYKKALFVLDWAYGRILAVHFIPRGAGYLGEAEVFLRGRPLNVTDLAFGPEGSLYFVTGGRKTQSGLYRVTYTGPVIKPPPPSAQELAREGFSKASRETRRKLEAFHGKKDARAVAAVWPDLVHPDPRIRYAARIALEHQPLESWREQARKDPSIEALTAWIGAAGEEEYAEILSLVARKRLGPLTLDRKLAVLELYSDLFSRMSELSEEQRRAALAKLSPLYPSGQVALDRALLPLVVRIEPGRAVPEAMGLLTGASPQWDLIHTLFRLRHAKEGWTPELRDRYFRFLKLATGLPGGRGKPKMMASIRKDALAALSEEDRKKAEKLLDVQPPPPPLPDLSKRRIVRKWSLADFDGKVDAGGDRDLVRGRKLFDRALCSRCHRVGKAGYDLGPDLTSAGSRYTERDLLEAILEPSKVVADAYKTDMIRMKDGRVLTGQIIPQLDYRSPEMLLAPSPFEPHKTEKVVKADVDSHRKSELSLMPTGLVDILELEEILDLLAWVRSGGGRGR